MDPPAGDLDAAARARGHDHPRALRTLGRAWSPIVWQCWQDRTPDYLRHRQQLPTACLGYGPHIVRPRARHSRHPADARLGRHQLAARRAEREALDGKLTSA